MTKRDKQIHKLFEAKAMKERNPFCHDCDVEMMATNRPRGFICQNCGYEAKRKPTKEECERLVEIVRDSFKPDTGCETLEKMFRDCGRPIEFLDCVATDGAKSTTPTVKPKGKL